MKMCAAASEDVYCKLIPDAIGRNGVDSLPREEDIGPLDFHKLEREL